MTTETIPAITKESIKATLREVVKENPDKVYVAPKHMDPEGFGSCFYVHKDEEGNQLGAGCIVGTVLHRLGISLEALSQVEGLSAPGALTGLDLDPDTHMGAQLRRVQMAQDRGHTWGQAYYAEFGEQA
ncbi:hypothetical protein ACQEVY_25560 [Streptomyces sp. CA-288835]|uniref:hypothetical protein n=1 Tax=Streptomyces sp. CA-288835 TaxID=3240069 RepID=UPI003D9017B2